MKYDSTQRELHVLFMREILLAINSKNYPTYLKGGTALLLCYGLDRFSEDIDLDSEKSFNLENTIKEASKKLDIVIDSINVPKDTETTKRYKVHYNGDMYLKIETSFRNKINENDVSVKNGIRVYNPDVILGMKFSAIYGERARTKARDFHDVVFLAKNYGSLFSKEQIDIFINLSKDIDKMLSFEDDYSEDSILNGEFENDVNDLEKQAQKLTNRKGIKSILKEESNKKNIHPSPSLSPDVLKKPWER